MKRDMELVRLILLKIEEHPHAMGFVPLEFEGVPDDVVSYHVKLLADHGIIEATNASSLRGICWRAKRLTWDGHDFIEAIREESNWSRAKKWVLDAGKLVTIETLKLAVKSIFH